MAVRRRQLFVGVVSVAVATLNAASVGWRVRPDASDIAARRIAGLFHDTASAAAVGRRYLARFPHERDSGFLLRSVLAGQTPATDDGLRFHLARRRQRDFEAGRVVVLEGWLLSLTESRLFALVALRSASGS